MNQGSATGPGPHPSFIEALLDPRAYRETTRRPRLKETHISWLLFTDNYVYKVKKPLDFGFLDFSTLERRKHFCEEEVRLNRRLSPGVYLGVEEITKAGTGPEEDGEDGDGGPAFVLGGRGPAVDYAVKMRRLPEDGWLAGLLERDEADASMIQRIAGRIADFHGSAQAPEWGEPGASVALVKENTEENFQQTADCVGWTLSTAAYDAVRAYTRNFLQSRRDLFVKREAEGHVRDCHGDLHAAQICVENGIDFIDCIEFNDRFRVGDTAADLAFLSMDLEARGHPELARVLVDEYQARRQDEGLNTVLDFYQCYRAFTRGKVESFRARQLPEGTDDRHEATRSATRYFELARAYASPRGPQLIVMTGLMGTGKSTVARLVGDAWAAVVLRSDKIRKELSGIPTHEHQYTGWQQGIYSEERTEETYEEMHRRASEALASGAVVVLDGSYSRNRWRQAARELAAEHDAGFTMVETRCAPDRVRERLAEREQSGDDVSDGRWALAARQAEEYDPPLDDMAADWVPVRSDGPPDDLGYRVLVRLYGATGSSPARRPLF
ncbi:MAG: AAA family ATPase [Gemmatimonadetes bacterium]|nr:AAA family ATPase [Gemmatimonadota bacterium]